MAEQVPRGRSEGQWCQLCGAWRGSLGLEPDPDLYVQHIVTVFREARRVLRTEGSLWLNLGDCYLTKPHGAGSSFDPKYPGGRNRDEGFRSNRTNSPAAVGLKSKDLAMIPFRVALALQGDGWYLRHVIPWLKRNGMPESTKDRPTTTVEFIFLLSKSEDYYYDPEAVRIKASQNTHSRGNKLGPKSVDRETTGRANRDFHAKTKQVVPSRLRRSSDWFFESWQGLLQDEAGLPLAMVINPQPFSIEMCGACERIYERTEYRTLRKHESGRRMCHCGATTWVSHFATFPERMVRPCILASTSEAGYCGLCGAPWTRIVERQATGDLHPQPELKAAGIHRLAKADGNGNGHETRIEQKGTREGSQFSQTRMSVNTYLARSAGGVHDNAFSPPQTLGWKPSCTCHEGLFDPGSPVPAIVLDPFAGSGRTGLAAAALGRAFRGIELNSKYCKMARWSFSHRAEDGHATL